MSLGQRKWMLWIKAITITGLECCMKLMNHNVSIRNVDACIRAVLDLVGRDVSQLPKKSTIANMMVEARSLAHLQLADELPKQSDNTLHSVWGEIWKVSSKKTRVLIYTLSCRNDGRRCKRFPSNSRASIIRY